MSPAGATAPGQLIGPRHDLAKVLGAQPVMGLRLKEKSRQTAGRTSRRPGVVKAGEVVVDPRYGCVAEPGVDMVALPQITVGVAAGDLRVRQVDVRQRREPRSGPIMVVAS